MPEPLVGQRLDIPGSPGVRLPVACNLAMGQTAPHVRRAVVYVHGSGGPGFKYFARAMQAVRGHAGAAIENGAAVPDELHGARETLVIAPQFLSPSDYIGPGPIPQDVLWWTSPFWGQDAGNGGHPSSFLALDEILRHVCDPQRYRNLDRVVFVGHSGGGQILNRYAAAGQGERLHATPRGVRVRYVIMNPGSYLYFDGQRHQDPSEDQFGIYSDPTGTCPKFDEWGRGTAAGLPPYVTARGLTPADLAANYRERDVVHLVGQDDNATSGGGLPPDCGQGDHRLQRSRIYFNYLNHVFGSEVMDGHQHAIIPGVKHSGGQMIRSPITRRFLLEDYRGSPQLNRRADRGSQAGTIGEVAITRHWDDDSNNSDDQYVTAVSDSSGAVRLIAWRSLQGALRRVASTTSSGHAASSIGLVRVTRTDSTPDGPRSRLTYVTAHIEETDVLRLTAWHTTPQGTSLRIGTASDAEAGRAELVDIARLAGERFVTVQRTPEQRMVVKTWGVGDGGTFVLLDTTGVISGPVDEITLVKRSRSNFLVVATTPPSSRVRLVHLRADNTNASTLGALTTLWDHTLPTDRGTDICATFGPYPRPDHHLVVGYRDASTARFRLVSFKVTSTTPVRLNDSANQVGVTWPGTSITAMPSLGLCTAVRTDTGHGKLIIWRIAPNGMLRRVSDSGASIGRIGRDHALGQPSAVTGDLFFACSDDDDHLKLIRFRYHS